MRLLSTALLICSEIWKMYNVGNGFRQISELLQLKWLSIVSQPFREFTSVAGQIQLEKELSYQLHFPGHSLKAFRTNLEKRWQLHTYSCASNSKVWLVSPKLIKTHSSRLTQDEENLTALHTSILRYYNN